MVARFYLHAYETQHYVSLYVTVTHHSSKVCPQPTAIPYPVQSGGQPHTKLTDAGCTNTRPSPLVTNLCSRACDGSAAATCVHASERVCARGCGSAVCVCVCLRARG